MDVLLNCLSCGGPLDRSAKACTRCGTPVVHTNREVAAQTAAAVGSAAKSTAPTAAAVAIHLCGVIGILFFIILWIVPLILWIVPLVCAFLKEGNMLRTHARVFWRWGFDFLATVLAALIPLAIVGVILSEVGYETEAKAILILGCVILAAFFVIAIICGIKAAMAASDGIVYAYPKLLLSKFGVV